MATGEGLTRAQDYTARLERARDGLKLVLIPVGLLFVVLTFVYMARLGLIPLGDSGAPAVRGWGHVRLPNGLLAVNTLVLLLSSICMEALRRSSRRSSALGQLETIPGVTLGKEKRPPWLAATVVLGLLFLGLQYQAWRILAARGFYIATNPISTFTYLLTATHAAHLAGGILGLLWLALPLWRKRDAERRSIRIEMLAWYWHFMALLWVYVLALLEWGA